MANTRKRNVEYYTLVKKIWRQEDVFRSFEEIVELLKFIKRKPILNRIYDFKDNKSGFLASYSSETINDCLFIKGFFKSATKNFRPNLLDTDNGTERPSPKKLKEGDKEKTHFTIKIDLASEDKEVFVIIEKNGHGVTINNIVSYLTYFNNQKLVLDDKKRSYSIMRQIIAREDFFEALQQMQRVRIAELYMDKSLIGSDALNFSDRLISAKRDVVVTVTAERDFSLSEFGFDCVQKLQGRNSKLSKIRIYGKDENGHELMIDSSFMGKKTEITVDVNGDTGEVATPSIYAELRVLAEALI